MKRTEPDVVELSIEELHRVLERAELLLQKPDYEAIKLVVQAYRYIADELGKSRVSVGRLKRLLFGARTEKTKNVLGDMPDDSPSPPAEKEVATESRPETDAENSPESQPSKRRKGHGRNGVAAYPGAEKIPVPHPSLKAGDDCPNCYRSEEHTS